MRDPAALGHDLGDPPVDLAGVVERRERGGLRDAAHGEGRPHLAQRGDHVGATERVPDP